MSMELIVAIIGGVLTIVNTIVGIALTNLFKSHTEIQATLAQNQGDIRVNAAHLDHLMGALQEHTENDRTSFTLIRDQQREHHQDNLKLMLEIKTDLKQLPHRRSDPESRYGN